MASREWLGWEPHVALQPWTEHHTAQGRSEGGKGSGGTRRGSGWQKPTVVGPPGLNELERLTRYAQVEDFHWFLRIGSDVEGMKMVVHNSTMKSVILYRVSWVVAWCLNRYNRKHMMFGRVAP